MIDYSIIIGNDNINILNNYIESKNNIHNGIDISADIIYSLQTGTVIEVGKSVDNYYCISIQSNWNTVFRYNHLQSVAVLSGQYVVASQYIGAANKFVHFQYANRDENLLPVRIYNQTFYLHNPESYNTEEL